VTVALPPGEQHIVRLDIAMHDAVGVCIGQARATSRRMLIRLGDRERAVGEPRPHARTIHERHRVERQPLELARRQDGHDVGVLQPGRDLDLALEPVNVDAARQLRGQDLDDDLPPSDVSSATRPATCTAAQFALDRVWRPSDICSRSLRSAAKRA
jgi:hypothetical protein